MTAAEHVRCPACATPVSEKTLAKFGGVCRRCYKQPIGFRKQWIFWGLAAILSPIAAFLMDQDLAAMEDSGDTRRLHIVYALAYDTAGRTGVIALFAIFSIISLVLCIRCFRKARDAKKQIEMAGQK